MPMFPTPEDLISTMKQFEDMNEEMARLMPKEMAGAVNLFAHPFAGAAAASALGVGMASHAFGLWAGAFAGAAEVSQRLFQPLIEEMKDRVESFEQEPELPAVRARAAAETVIADARVFAEEIAGKPAAQPGRPRAGKARGAAVAALAPPTEALPPEDFRQPKAVRKPLQPDDLKAIDGIGPKLEQVLNGLGIWTYAQIAGWQAPEVAWVEDTLGFKGRIGRDGWVAQAQALAAPGTAGS